MDYIELFCKIESEQIALMRDIIVHELSDIGYESFMEIDNGLLAYIPYSAFNPEFISDIRFNKSLLQGKINFNWKVIKDQNWNEEWENNFPPVQIGDKCYVRATFHKPNNKIPYEIIIEPKMSFGTGHHETTFLMISQMLTVNFKEKKVLDMGCGTGILSILASKLGADTIYAVDIDEWAYNNTIENSLLNNITNVNVKIGDKNAIPPVDFDIIIANINRNIILQDIKTYIKHLITNGYLIISGFYIDDLPVMVEKLQDYLLCPVNNNEKNRWVAALFQKK